MRFSSLFCCLLCWKKKKLNELALHKKEERRFNKIPILKKNNNYNQNKFNVKDSSITMTYINKNEVRNRNSVLNEENTNSLPDLKTHIEKISPIISYQPERNLKREINLPNLDIPDKELEHNDLSIGTSPTETSSSKSESSKNKGIDMSQSVLEDVVNAIYNQPHPSQSILQLRDFIDHNIENSTLDEISSGYLSSDDEDAPMEEIRLSSPTFEINKYERERRQSSISQADKVELEQEGYDVMSDLDSPFNEK